MKKKQEETKMSKIINIAWKVALVAAALCAAPAYAEGVDFSKIPDVRIFKGDETIGYRDPAAWYEEFQAEYLSNSVDFAIRDKDIQGVAVWQFCDSRSYFRGGSDIRTRPLGCNMAGLFDIHRREKLAAKVVRRLFTPSAK